MFRIKYLDTHFDDFINCELMNPFKDRIKWIRIDLLGQEKNAMNLKKILTKYYQNSY